MIAMLIEDIVTWSVEYIFCIWHQVCDLRNSIIRGTQKNNGYLINLFIHISMNYHGLYILAKTFLKIAVERLC